MTLLGIPDARGKNDYVGPGWLAQLVGVLSRCAKVAGSVSGQGTNAKQPMNALKNGTTKRYFSLSQINNFF